jgi:hypothetical protein
MTPLSLSLAHKKQKNKTKSEKQKVREKWEGVSNYLHSRLGKE